MKRMHWAGIFALSVGWIGSKPISAQQPPQFPAAEKEHAFLKKFVGEWETVSETTAAEGQPLMTVKGKMKARMLGDFWVVAESEADVMGMQIASVMTLGYDGGKKKYIGTWVDSAMNHLWHYEGSVDGSKIALHAEGPNFMVPGKTAKFRDIWEFKSDDEITLTSQMQDESGTWTTFMKGKSKRKKG